jgi:hypothetical protein
MPERLWRSLDTINALHALCVYGAVGVVLAGIVALHRHRHRGERDAWFRLLSSHEYMFLLVAVLWPIFLLAFVAIRLWKRRAGPDAPLPPDRE